jgi:hypothetical protein
MKWLVAPVLAIMVDVVVLCVGGEEPNGSGVDDSNKGGLELSVVVLVAVPLP